VRLGIGAGGYNLVHETTALQVPAVFWPRPRKYDDQFRRVAARPCAIGLASLYRAVFRELQRSFIPSSMPAYNNGATAAAGIISRRQETAGIPAAGLAPRTIAG
jgi:hypothetical protein